MKVRALENCIYPRTRRYKGEIFEFKGEIVPSFLEVIEAQDSKKDKDNSKMQEQATKPKAKSRAKPKTVEKVQDEQVIVPNEEVLETVVDEEEVDPVETVANVASTVANALNSEDALT